MMDPTDGWKAFFVQEVDNVAIYDLYDTKDDWQAQVRFDRRKSGDVYVLFPKDSPAREWLQRLNGRDAWRPWLVAHRATL